MVDTTGKATYFRLYLRKHLPRKQAEELEGTLLADQVQEDNALETVIAQEIGTTYKAVKKAPYPTAVKDTGAMGYRAARVRTFFRLPPHFNHPHLLAYVEWYSDLRAAPAAGTEMYVVKETTQTEIIHVESIHRSCFLIPKFGKRAERAWESEDSLDLATHFYISNYLDLMNCDENLGLEEEDKDRMLKTLRHKSYFHGCLMCSVDDLERLREVAMVQRASVNTTPGHEL
ncbi:hypothetical protein M422DRAFT_245579 [Sphaerobolus stellatus SS14]|nr:hypothetical protein M422DRAFT_245579 [Sphaerobolus stellatus SS14]